MHYFNPRSREGSDIIVYFFHLKCGNFNPRSREGSDLPLSAVDVVVCISIHAPARGATRFRLLDSLKRQSFQSTLPRGERLGMPIYAEAIEEIFQSTLPRGERQSIAYVFEAFASISIHAPARGATDLVINRIPQHCDFNPRSREGSDQRLIFYAII